ncbi:olfactory receptor 4X1-like, partial [Macaca thibetana thibetana]|uniref:olfactory receptor 4X1-like n=1 Tax=Macaca thibetana thibetana TaxID=257877 RepID=UPI0021BCF2BF
TTAATKNVTEIIFLGFSQNQNEQRVISVMFLLMCTAVVPGNGLIVVNILASKGLTSPMYFLLSYVSFVEICYCSVVAPKLIFDSFIKWKVIFLFPPDDGGSISVVSFSVRIASYLIILHSLRSHNWEARRRELSTCASHITVVGLFFMPCSFVCMRPCVTLPADKIVAVFYTVVTPLLNPVIYSFRNAEAKNAMRRRGGRKVIREEK